MRLLGFAVILAYILLLGIGSAWVAAGWVAVFLHALETFR